MGITVGPTQWQLSATIPSVPLGTWMAPGYLICKCSGVALAVAPSCSEVCRTWYCRNDAIVQANLCTGAAGWFIPSYTQLSTGVFCCNQYWDCISNLPAFYWSNSEYDGGRGYCVNTCNGAGIQDKSICCLVRAFRCITY